MTEESIMIAKRIGHLKIHSDLVIFIENKHPHIKDKREDT